MQLNFAVTLIALALASVGTAMPSAEPGTSFPAVAAAGGQVLDTRGNCGPKPGPCNENGCEGKNTPWDGKGTCEAGKYDGCECKGVCNHSVNGCYQNGCKGLNGACTAGKYKGCWCYTTG